MACANGHPLGGALHVESGVHVVEHDLTVECLNEEVEAYRAHQRFGVGVVDESLTVAQHPLRGDHRCGRPDAGRQIP